MFDFRMPLPLDFMYDTCELFSWLYPLKKTKPLGLWFLRRWLKFNPARIEPNFKHWVFLSKYRMQPKFTKCC